VAGSRPELRVRGKSGGFPFGKQPFSNVEEVMKRALSFAYGAVAYALFFGSFLYAAGFLGNFLVPKSLDSPASGSFPAALLVNGLLLGLFAVQHSVMARSGFKAWLTKFVPEHLERSTYVLASSLLLILLFWQWRPMGGIIWDVQSPVARAALYGLFAAGWLIVLVASFLINHFDLFGLRQVWLHLRKKPYTQLQFRTPGLYKLVRHPLYVGWFLALWATPTMTAAHLFFAVMTAGYILVAIQLEERDLVRIHGADYVEYRRRIPMLVPGLKKSPEPEAGVAVNA
jgi:methanethiol S-methyltransferase